MEWRCVDKKSFFCGRLCGVLLVTIFAFLLFPVSHANRNALAANGTTTYATTSIDISTTNSSASASVVSPTNNGSFAASDAAHTAEFTVATNGYTGYTLSISADDDSGRLTNTDLVNNTSSYIDSITSATTEADFSNNNATSYNNKWGFKPSKYKNASGDIVENTGSGAVFLPAPTTTATVLDKTSSANIAPNEYSIALGVRVSKDTTAGTYSKSFNLIATANPSIYNIHFDKNTTDEVTNMPGDLIGDGAGANIILPSTVPVRESRTFLGWCTVVPTTKHTSDNDIDECTGTGAAVFKENNEGTGLIYGINQTTNNSITLYAMWRTNRFTVTLEQGSLVSNLTGAGVYEAGDTVTLTADKEPDTNCGIYSVPYWNTDDVDLEVTGGETITFTMPYNDVDIYVYSNQTSILLQSITLVRNNGANSISINGTSYTGTSASIQCGTYTMSGTYATDYRFSSWAASGNISVASTSSASTTVTISGSGTITLNGRSNVNTFDSVYADAGKSKTSGYYSLQDMTSTLCSSIDTGQSGSLRDSRDGEVYAVGKLADGRCWIIDNMRIDLVAVSLATLKGRTNASDTSLEYLKGSRTSTTSDQYPRAAVAYWTKSYTYSEPLIKTTGSDMIDGYNKGTFYNYCAASAGSFCYGNGTSAGSGTTNATEDICPKGWRMPTGGTTASGGEYSKLYDAVGSYANMKSKLHLGLIGYYRGTSFYNTNSNGYWWSSTNMNTSNMRYLWMSSAQIDVTKATNRYFGHAVKCIAK